MAPGATPHRLVVSVVPATSLCRSPDESFYVYAQAVDAAGVPLAATPAGQPPLVVTFTSSDRTVAEPYGSDGNRATIDRGSSYGRGAFVSRATSSCGTATITASAPGYEPVSANITTVPRGGEAVAIKLFAFPERLPANGREIQLAAQLVDARGAPAYLKSRATMRVEGVPPESLVTPSREVAFSDSFTITYFGASITERAGPITLSAVLPGLKSAPVRLTIEPPPAAAGTAALPPAPTVRTVTPPADSPAAQPSLPAGAAAIPTATLTDEDVCDQSRWPTLDVPWQKASSPSSPAANGGAVTAAVAPPLEFATLTSIQYGGAVSAAIESMRLVYGPLSAEDTARFERKWAPLLDFPTAEIVAYLNQLNPLLGQFLVARSGYAAAANGLFAALHDGGLAMANGSGEGAGDGWRQATAYRDLMASYEARLREIVAAIEALGNPPNPYDLKCRARRRARQALSIFEATGRATFQVFIEERRLSRVLAPQICAFEGTRPLVGATVVFDGPSKATAVTDGNGTASVSSLAPGQYRVRILDAGGRDLDAVARTFRSEHPEPPWPGGPRRNSIDMLLCDDTLAGASRLPPQGLVEFALDAKTATVERQVAFGANLFGIDASAERAKYIAELEQGIAQRNALLGSGYEKDGVTKLTPARLEQLQATQQYRSTELRYEQGLRGLAPQAPASITRGPVNATPPPSPPTGLAADEMAARREYIQAITRRVAAYDKQLATEADPDRISELTFLKLMAVTEIQIEQARLHPAADGQSAFIRTALGDHIRQAEYQKSVEEAARSRALGQIWTAIDKQIAILPGEVGDNWKTVVNERANRRGTSLEDLEKAEQALSSVANTVQDYWSREAGRQRERAEYYEWVENTPKTISKVSLGIALVGLSGPAAVSMFGETALAMTWAPRAAGFVYGGVTGYREGGPVEGVKGALSWASGVTFAGVEAYNGYEQEMARSGDWLAATEAGTLRAGEAYLVGKLFEKTFNYGAALFGPPTRGAAPQMNLPRYQQELQGAQQKIAAFKRASDDLASATGASAERTAALRQVQVAAAADINASYQAKLRLKYVDKETGRAYSQVMTSVFDDMASPVLTALERKGYDVSRLRLTPIRNASSEGTVGMDFDLKLEQPVGQIIRKYGERVSALTFEKDAQAALNDLYFARMGRNPEKSFLTFTTRSHPEAYQDLAWLGDSVTKKINFDGLNATATQAAEVTAFKARHAINASSLSGVSKVQEATRGLAKDVNTKVVPYIDYKLKAAEVSGDAAAVARLRALKAQWTTIGAEYEAVGTTVGDAGSILSRLRDLEARGLGVAKVTDIISSHMEMLSKFY